ncbi:MAG: class I SAM-dependent methyltransferase [Alphaproteobacteria bacterium]|nr:class I SAM-dependent methyltransferase [Alphaproteobacteria bacterium]
MKQPEIFLNNQTRNRGYGFYEHYLCLKRRDNYSPGKSILIIGGGEGVYTLANKVKSDITNVDLQIHPELAEGNRKITDVQSDFIATKFKPDMFDEIWALFSLPLYSPSPDAVRLFFAKSAYSLKPGGILRIAPATPVSLFENTNRPAIKRNVTNRPIFKALYACMDKFAQIGGGGHSVIHWTHECSGEKNLSSEKIIEEIGKLDSFSWTNFGQYKNISHDLRTNCRYNCATVAKAAQDSEYINKMLLADMRRLNKLNIPKTIVHAKSLTPVH